MVTNRKKIEKTIFIEEGKLCSWIWLSSLISLIILCWTYLPSIYIHLPISEEICNALNSISQGICISYFSGTVFYVFSVFIPGVRKKYINNTAIASSLTFLKNNVDSVMAATGDNLQRFSNDTDLLSFTKRLFQEDVSVFFSGQNADSISPEEKELKVHLNHNMVHNIKTIIEHIHSDLSHVKMISIHLDNPEFMLIIAGLEHCSFFKEINNLTINKQSFDEHELLVSLGYYKFLIFDYIFYR
ncbi:MAG: hypothetical protein KBT06_06420, partial [Prevotellaceae bacterium]|nr:hypothetical protein [Candidatus Colivivens equi]